MGYSCFVFSAFVMLLVASSHGARVGLFNNDVYHGKNFISWDDMKVDEHNLARVSSRVDYNQSRVIVVDKNGGGDSVTVQGAIDMVSEGNKHRVKIYILPGIYRSACILHNYLCFYTFQRSISLAALRFQWI